MSQMRSKVNLATFQHCQDVGPNRLGQFHLHVGIAFRVAVQEIRKDTFDDLRGACHLQDAGVAAAEQLRPLADCAGVVQQTTAVREQLLTLASQHEAASHAIEKFETELLFQSGDLSGQRRLGHAEAQGRLGDGPQLDHRDEGTHVLQVHAEAYAVSA